MKRIILLLILLFLTFFSRSQWINSFTVIPPNPTPTDTITIVVEVMFPSGSCEGTATIPGTSGNYFLAGAFHCLGMLAVICTDYDTLIILPQAPGNYNLQYTLTTGSGIPCVWDGNLPVVDSVPFTVSGTNDLPVIKASNQISIFPNPSDGKFIVRNEINMKGNLNIYTRLGQKVATFKDVEEIAEIELNFPPGVYFALFENERMRYSTKLIITDQLFNQ